MTFSGHSYNQICTQRPAKSEAFSAALKTV
jgi:hypothetical protein